MVRYESVSSRLTDCKSTSFVDLSKQWLGPESLEEEDNVIYRDKTQEEESAFCGGTRVSCPYAFLYLTLKPKRGHGNSKG